jgi:16S rRNA (adenine1518-N6/adenine1519-N6)-dimethyltransferase
MTGRKRRQRLGQHFLVDRGIARRIVGLLDDAPGQVLEIGPGKGALTGPLLERFDRVLALEKDEHLATELPGRLGPGSTCVEIHPGDALHDDIEPLLVADAPWQVASNLPYSVGTAILRRLLPRHDLITRLVVMLQAEVVDRLIAEPAGSGHGLLALERAAFAEARLAFQVSRDAFRPRPKVMSAVVTLDLHPPKAPPELLGPALALAARALTRPRKMLPNALGGTVNADHLATAGLDPSARPGTVALEGWIALARTLAAAEGL